MEYLSTKRVQLAKVKLPGDIAKRRKSQHAAELAQSFKMLGGGPAHFPVYDTAGNIVVGRDRMAALLEIGAKTTEVRIVKGTPDELKALELWENLGKRPEDRDALLAELVTVTERMLTQGANTGTTVPEKAKAKGRKKTNRGAAREIVAKAAGIDPESVRKAEVRHAAEERKEERIEAAEERAAEGLPSAPDHVHHYDLNTKERGVLMARQMCDCGDFEPYDQEWNQALDVVLKHLWAGVTALKMLQPVVAHKPDLLRYVGELNSTIASLELRRLVAPCPMEAHTNGQPCVCDGLGWVSEYQRAAIPAPQRPRAELKAPEARKGSKKEKGGAMAVAAAPVVAGAVPPSETTEAPAAASTAAGESTVEGVTKVDPPSGDLPGTSDEDIWTASEKPKEDAEVIRVESGPPNDDDF